jgi:hypothetical protein
VIPVLHVAVVNAARSQVMEKRSVETVERLLRPSYELFPLRCWLNRKTGGNVVKDRRWRCAMIELLCYKPEDRGFETR